MRSLLLILAAGILAACDKTESAGHSAGPTPKAAEFKQGQGLLLTDEASRFIGLRSAEAQTKGALVRIPLSAVVETSEGKHVFVRNGQRWLRTAVKLGAIDYLSKPADADEIYAALTQAPEKKAEPPENPMSADRVRWEHIQRVYELCNHNVSETARRLNMHRRTLQRILAKRAPR